MLRKKDRARIKLRFSGNISDYLVFSMLRSDCKKKINECYDEYLVKLQENIKTNIKLFLAFTKSKRKYPTQFKYDKECTSSPKEICYLFAKFFKFTYPNRSPDRSFDITQTVNPNTVNPINIKPNDVVTIISKCDLNKNGGPDGIPNRSY